MTRVAQKYGSDLTVFVFPSLALIDQFSNKYLENADLILKVSSDVGATTDITSILKFLAQPEKKIVCVTYHSFDVLIDAVRQSPARIGLCCYDEAHHTVGEVYQKFIFENAIADKQVFFTATPKNANGIVMHNSNCAEIGICGKVVYEYSYLRGINDGFLNPFELRVDFGFIDTIWSKYECIARAILATGNQRVLTFHATVRGDSDTSVLRFVNETKFTEVLKNVQKKEFPNNKRVYIVRMLGIDANTDQTDRRMMLKLIDDADESKVIVLSSCETIGEGVDTRKANMCVFVDPKSSSVKIIQNIGRIVRKVANRDVPSTVLLCCYVDRVKYQNCADRMQIDEVMRQDMSKTGNWKSIQSIATALKQHDVVGRTLGLGLGERKGWDV
jgi:superfamily II DNA or RNA helicase